MTIKDLILNAEMYQYSNEAYQIKKECMEIDLLESCIQNQIFLFQNKEELKHCSFTEGYFSESVSRDNIISLMESSESKVKNLFGKIMAGIIRAITNIIDFFKTIFNKFAGLKKREENVLKELTKEEITVSSMTTILENILDDKTAVKEEPKEEPKPSNVEEEPVVKEEPKPVQKQKIAINKLIYRLLDLLPEGRSNKKLSGRTISKHDFEKLDKELNFTKGGEGYKDTLGYIGKIKYDPEIPADAVKHFGDYLKFILGDYAFLGKNTNIYVEGSVSYTDIYLFMNKLYNLDPNGEIDPNKIRKLTDDLSSSIKFIKDTIEEVKRDGGYLIGSGSIDISRSLNDMVNKNKAIQRDKDKLMEKYKSYPEIVKNLNEMYSILMKILPPTFKTYTNFYNERVKAIVALEKWIAENNKKK